MKKNLQKKPWKKRILTWLIGSFTISTALAACAPPSQNLLSYSSKQSQNLGLPIYDIPEPSENFFKAGIYKGPTDVDVSYAPNEQLGGDKNIDVFFPPSFLLKAKSYQTTIANLTADDVRNDVLDSLIEFSTNNNLSIDFTNLVLNFSLNKITETKLQLNNFFLQFGVTNSSLVKQTLFNEIELAPQSHAFVELSFIAGNIVPAYIIGNSDNGDPNALAAAWTIQTSGYNGLVKLTYKSQPFDGNVSTSQFEKINFLSGRSYAINQYFRGFGNLPNFNEIYPQAITKILSQSPADFKKDINDWFIQYLRFQSYLSWLDVVKVFKYLISPTTKNQDGKATSLLEQIVKMTSEKRTHFFKQVNFTGFGIDLINAVLGQNESYVPPTYQQIYVFVQDILALKFEDFLDKGIEVKINWIQDPQIFLSDIKNPKISYQFSATTTFKQDLKILFKGKGRYENQDVSYDVSNFLVIKNFLNILNGTNKPADSSKPASSGSDAMFAGMLDQLQQYVKIDKLEVKKGEKFTINFQAQSSPLQFYISQSIDRTKASNALFGWQASNVATTFDFSGIKTLWSDLYKTLNSVTSAGFKILDDKDALTKGDIKKILQFLSFAFVPSSEQNKYNDPVGKNRQIRPIEVLFNTILQKEYVVTSMPMRIIVSRAFYQLLDAYDDKPLWIKDKNSNSYSNNPAISLTKLVPSSSHKPPQNDDPTNLNSNSALFNFDYKDKLFALYADYYSFEFFSENLSIMPYFDLDVKAIYEKLETNEKFTESAQLQIQKTFDAKLKNNFNKDLKTQVSLIRIPLSDAVNSVFNMEVHAPILQLAQTLGILNLSGIPKNAFKRDPFLIIINTQIPGGYAAQTANSRLTIGDANPTLFYFVPPVIDFSKIQINTR